MSASIPFIPTEGLPPSAASSSSWTSHSPNVQCVPASALKGTVSQYFHNNNNYNSNAADDEEEEDHSEPTDHDARRVQPFVEELSEYDECQRMHCCCYCC